MSGQNPTEGVIASAPVVPVVAAQPEAPVVPTTSAQVVSTLPVAVIPETNERTQEQFQKLLESNKKLYQANETLRQEMIQRAAAQQQFAPIQQPPVQNTQQPVNPQDFIEVDPYTGERAINEGKLSAALQEVNARASRAEAAVQQYVQTSEQREVDRQNREAFASYPELNPTGGRFNTLFSNQTRAAIYDSLVNPQDYGGKPLSFKDAADFVKANMTVQPSNTPAPASAVVGAQPVQPVSTGGAALKEQAAAGAVGQQPDSRTLTQHADEDLESLKVQTRKGSLDALARRLMHTEHIVPSETKVT